MCKTHCLHRFIFFTLFLEVAPLPPRLLTLEHAKTCVLKRWRSWFPAIYSSIYLKQGGGGFILGKEAEEPPHSSAACSCIRKFLVFPKLFSYFLLRRLAEERRSSVEHWDSQLFAYTCIEEPHFCRCRFKLQNRVKFCRPIGVPPKLRNSRLCCGLLRNKLSENHL